jgi:PAS domain S-box-containing protein
MTIGLRTKLLLPLVAAALAIGAGVLILGPGVPQVAGVTLAMLLLLGVMVVDVEVVVLRPLRTLLRSARELAQGRPPGAPADAARAPMQALADSLAQVRARLLEVETALTDERHRRQMQEQSLRELEERYALAVERANDGIWEWNVKTGVVDCSARWKAMLRLPSSGVQRIEDWQQMLHPEERAGVVLRLENHLNGLTPIFEESYRLRQGDGSYRWVQSRGVAIRHASGKAYRVLVMDNDIHERRQLEMTLIQAAEGLCSVSGEDFYRALMRSLSELLGTRDNLVCLCVGEPPTKARTLAYYSSGTFHDNFEYELAGTSCAAVIERGEIVYCPTGVGDVWPDERQYDRDSYIGVPMFDSGGKIIGHFACMDGGPMRQDLPHLALFKIFAVRAAAEVERSVLRQRLESGQAVV